MSSVLATLLVVRCEGVEVGQRGCEGVEVGQRVCEGVEVGLRGCEGVIQWRGEGVKVSCHDKAARSLVGVVSV